MLAAVILPGRARFDAALSDDTARQAIAGDFRLHFRAGSCVLLPPGQRQDDWGRGTRLRDLIDGQQQPTAPEAA